MPNDFLLLRSLEGIIMHTDVLQIIKDQELSDCKTNAALSVSSYMAYSSAPFAPICSVFANLRIISNLTKSLCRGAVALYSLLMFFNSRNWRFKVCLTGRNMWQTEVWL